MARAVRIFVALALLFSFAFAAFLPMLAVGHTCHHDACTICCACEISTRLFCLILFCGLALSFSASAVRALIRTRAVGRLFYTPVALKVKLTD